MACYVLRLPVHRFRDTGVKLSLCGHATGVIMLSFETCVLVVIRCHQHYDMICVAQSTGIPPVSATLPPDSVE